MFGQLTHYKDHAPEKYELRVLLRTSVSSDHVSQAYCLTAEGPKLIQHETSTCLVGETEKGEEWHPYQIWSLHKLVNTSVSAQWSFSFGESKTDDPLGI